MEAPPPPPAGMFDPTAIIPAPMPGPAAPRLKRRRGAHATFCFWCKYNPKGRDADVIAALFEEAERGERDRASVFGEIAEVFAAYVARHPGRLRPEDSVWSSESIEEHAAVSASAALTAAATAVDVLTDTVSFLAHNCCVQRPQDSEATAVAPEQVKLLLASLRDLSRHATNLDALRDARKRARPGASTAVLALPRASPH